MTSKIQLYINTVKYLKPSQIYYRLLNKTKRELYKRNLKSFKYPNNIEISNKLDFLIPELDFNKEYLDRFDIKEILNNEFTFINIKNKVDLSGAWNNKDLQHLWRYNLHYFEYLYVLAFKYLEEDKSEKYYSKFKIFIENWVENNPVGIGDGWHPYTISLRVTNWISVYKIFSDRITKDKNFDKAIKESLYIQYKYLQSILEKDVLGNHYFENIKALIICSTFFKDIKTVEKFKRELINQLKEQVLKDGMHFELSPMYHKIILEDLIKITYWLKEHSIYNNLVDYIQKMIDVTYSMEDNFGKTPAFNDSADGISKDYKCLLEVSKKYFNINPNYKDSFKESGFFIVEDKWKKLIFDAGDICPSYLPAHGHCDALSFELSIGGRPMIVNSGTYMYQNGEWRNHFRSTSAHNSVGISKKEQSQFWGSFRVAKRIKNIRSKQFKHNNINFCGGAYITYSGDEHKRYLGSIDENKLVVIDYVKSNSAKIYESYLHFIPGVEVTTKDNYVEIKKDDKTFKIRAIGCSTLKIEKGYYSEKFNVKSENQVLVLSKDDKKNCFGYIIDFTSESSKTELSKNELKIIDRKQIIINLNELEDVL